MSHLSTSSSSSSQEDHKSDSTHRGRIWGRCCHSRSQNCSGRPIRSDTTSQRTKSRITRWLVQMVQNTVEDPRPLRSPAPEPRRLSFPSIPPHLHGNLLRQPSHHLAHPSTSQHHRRQRQVTARAALLQQHQHQDTQFTALRTCGGRMGHIWLRVIHDHERVHLLHQPPSSIPPQP